MIIDESNIVDGMREDIALAVLLAEGVIFTNVVDLSLQWPQFYKEKTFTTACYVDCSDVFMWGCADAENIEVTDGEPPSEMIELYKLHRENSKWGSTKWACIKRGIQPQFPIKRDMKKDGYWDDVLENLTKNPSEK